jgi:HSP20 family protein
MWQNFTDLDRTFAALDALQRQLWRQPASPAADGFSFDAVDYGDAWVVTAALPGVPKEAIEVTLTGQVLRLAATRKTKAPVDGDDVVAHRVERPAFTFQKSITLPHKVDADKVSASAVDGVFTVTLPKAQDARPRAIAVR